jgi:mono/diheme cytochrome c family protein
VGRLLAGLALAAAVSAAAGVARAAGEHERRLGAEVAVMLGDARRLTEPMSDLQRAGVIDRIVAGLGGLPLLIRQAREADPTLPPLARAELTAVRKSLAERNLVAVVSGLAALSRNYPFDAAGIVPADAAPERLRLGKAIHESTCAGCHDHPDAEAALPAHDLFRWARAMPAGEFAARLYTGIRGDALTALANPFGAEDLAALFAYYRAGPEK